MTVLDVVRACASNAEFVANWARLRKVHLPNTPLESLIDDASGHSEDIAQMFIADVIDLVVMRTPEVTA